MTDRVAILLSTYNGSRFLPQQLDSLYAQSHTPLRILVRDDGSTDSTRDFLEREAAAGKIELLAGHRNLGAAASFLLLLQHAAEGDYAYAAFCDQDDVWLPGKISRALAALQTSAGTPALYCSRLEIVDAELNHRGMTPIPRRVGFGNALVENIAVGCTMVLNRQAITLVADNPPASVLIHDWWCYAVLSCFGRIHFDPEPAIRYRQHAGNAFGAGAGNIGGLARKLRRFSGGNGQHWQSEQAATLLAVFGDRLPPEARQCVQRLVAGRASWTVRLALALSRGTWRQKALDDVAQRVLFLLNRY